MSSTTLYRFQLELSDINRGVYETLDFRVAQHPSEHLPYLLTRVLAYALNFQEGLAFSATGLHDPDEAALSIPAQHGGHKLIIEIGSPSARKLHKASKLAAQVRVYNYKNPELMLRELRAETIYRAEEIEFFSLPALFLEELALWLKRDNKWGLLVDDNSLTLQFGEQSLSTELSTLSLVAP